MPFSRALTLRETQTVSSKILIPVNDSISYDHNRYDERAFSFN